MSRHPVLLREPLTPGALLEHDAALRDLPLAEPPGTVLEDILVPARGFMRARTLDAGQILRIVQVEGQQCADLVVFDADDMKDRCSMVMTTLRAGRWRLAPGDTVVSAGGIDMMRIIEDTVSAYQVCGGCCSPAMNEMRYGVEGTHSCLANLVVSMAQYDFSPADIGDAVFGVFFNMVYADDGSLVIHELDSPPGAYVDLRAETDLVVGLSACPQERNGGNNWNPKALRVQIYEP